ncbi:MAG: calcium-binding protein [Oculatellaceae cyanobacterium bins.114]|nr:calcium-binding protein [Oculatellaceae cyanobacterium bins.114]
MPSYLGTNFDDIISPTQNTTGGLLVDPTQSNYIYGLDGDDLLEGGNGNDYINGGTGVDQMSGGAGSNTYVVDDTNDLVITTTGFDTIWLSSAAPIFFDMQVNAATTQNLVMFQTSSTVNHNVSGNDFANTITGNLGDNQIFGMGGNDILYGNGGDDELDGGFGSDRLIGGAGYDIYYIDNVGDAIVEDSTEPVGFNEAFSTVSYTLSSHIFGLTLEGSANLNGTGNDWDNLLVGNIGRNTLDGGLGADTMVGGGGFAGDTFVVDNAGDRVIADGIGDYAGNPNPTGAGVNTISSSITLDLLGGVVLSGNVYNLVLSGTSNINALGNNLANYIAGNNGNNVLEGRDGSDFIYGFTGNDTLDGGAQNDILDGGLGADTFITSTGQDSYYVDNLGDVVVGTTGGPHRVFSSVSNYSLATNAVGVRDLTLTGSNPLSGAGNSLNNTIIGNTAGNTLSGLDGNDNLFGEGGTDQLTGGRGNDTLNGGAGADAFAYDNTVPFAELGIDTITDFSVGDTIRLSRSLFGLSGALISPISSTQFAAVTTDVDAAISTARIVYNSTNRRLYFNENEGLAGFGTGGAFVTLGFPNSPVPTLTRSNVVLIA